MDIWIQNKFAYHWERNENEKRKKLLPWVCSSVEASIDRTSTSQDPCPWIVDSISWNEVLRSWSWWNVCQCNVEVLQKWNIGVGERNTPSFKHQNTEVLRQGCSQRTPCCATSNYYVVIGIIAGGSWNWRWWEWACISDKRVSIFMPVLITCKNEILLIKTLLPHHLD